MFYQSRSIILLAVKAPRKWIPFRTTTLQKGRTRESRACFQAPHQEHGRPHSLPPYVQALGSVRATFPLDAMDESHCGKTRAGRHSICAIVVMKRLRTLPLSRTRAQTIISRGTSLLLWQTFVAGIDSLKDETPFCSSATISPPHRITCCRRVPWTSSTTAAEGFTQLDTFTKTCMPMSSCSPPA